MADAEHSHLPDTTALNLGRCQGRVAVVTGASSGVGAAIAALLAEQGARVAMLARGKQRLQEAATTIAAGGGDVLAVPCDCSDPTAIEKARERIHASIGIPTILINAAGTCGELSLIVHSDPQAWWQTLQVNLLAPYLMCRSLLAGMLAGGWGRIINVGSAASLHPPGAMTSSYAVSKSALDRFTRQLAIEIMGSGVTANVIHPGEVKTEMWQDIHDQAARGGEAAAGLRAWAELVERTGGDPPRKAAELVLRIIEDGQLHGRFLWIEQGVQPPLPSWDPPLPAAACADGSDHPVLHGLKNHQQRST